MAINVKIGTVSSIGRSDGLERTPDDRQTLLQTFDSQGVATATVEDNGYCENGEVISFSATFSAADYNTIVGYWTQRTRVQVVLDDGTIINNARIVVRRTQFFDRLINSYKTVQIEVWRV